MTIHNSSFKGNVSRLDFMNPKTDFFKKRHVLELRKNDKPDLFKNTEHADTRPESIKSFQDLQQEQEEQRKQNKMDVDGLPLFSENERETRITKQERLL